MQAQLWSLNALSVELGRDRRTLARELEGLPPDDEQAVGELRSGQLTAFDERDPSDAEISGKRILRRWRLKRVVEYLYGGDATANERLDERHERARLLKEQANKVAFANAVRSGELLEVHVVKQVWENLFTNVRTNLLSMPRRLAPLILNCKAASDAESMMRDVLYEIMTECSKYKPSNDERHRDQTNEDDDLEEVEPVESDDESKNSRLDSGSDHRNECTPDQHTPSKRKRARRRTREAPADDASSVRD